MTVDPLVARPGAAGDAARARRARPRPAHGPRRAATTCSSATARSPSSARPARSRRRRAPSSSTGEGRHLLPAFVDPHVHLRTPGPGAQGGPRDRHARRGRRRVLLRGRHAEHRPGASTRRAVLRSLRDGAARDARVPVGFMAAITRGLRGPRADRDGRAARRQGALGFTDDGRPVRQRRHAAQGAAVPAAGRRRAGPPRGGPLAVGRGRDARGRASARAWASPGSRA